MLNQFISAIEGGLGGASTRRESHGGSRGGEVDVKFAKGSGAQSHEEETSRDFTESPAARFERLFAAVATDPDGFDWIDVSQPNLELSTVKRGTLLSWECDFYTPEVVQILGKNSEMRSMMRMMQGLMPAALGAGLDTSGVPGASELGAMAGVLDSITIDHIIEGDHEDTPWKVFASLDSTHLLGDVDGPMGFMGKVNRIVSEGSYHPLISIPGMDFGSREQRRERARQAPPVGQEQNFISGPALELDLLAVFS